MKRSTRWLQWLLRKCARPVWFQTRYDIGIFGHRYHQYGIEILGRWIVCHYKSGLLVHHSSECREIKAMGGWEEYGTLDFGDGITRVFPKKEAIHNGS